jgi:glycosyltransferase involved in cell wall biosynthesis
MPPHDGNPLGYFENMNFSYKIDDALLTHLGGSWDNPPNFKENWEYDPSLDQMVKEAKALINTFSKSSKWGWKDPRTTILLPFWKSLIPDLRFVVCVRSPLEVAKSLFKRDRMPLQKGVCLWNHYMRAAIRDTAGCPRIFTFYEDYFDDAFGEIDRLIDFCGLQKPHDSSGLNEAVAGELRHHAGETLELLHEEQLPTEHKLLYLGLRALTIDGFVRSTSHRSTREGLISESIGQFFKLLERFHDQHEMARLQSAIAEAKGDREVWKAKTENLEKAIGALSQEVKGQQAALNQKVEQIGQLQTTVQSQQQFLNIIYASFGWKILSRIWKYTDIIFPVGTKRRMIAGQIRNLPSLLTSPNISRLIKHLRLFGFIATHKEVSANFLNITQSPIDTIPAINHVKVLGDEVVSTEKATISIVIPVKNAGDDLRILLSAMKDQKGFNNLEIIVVDSGSTDKSLEIATELGVKIVKILPQDFTHSYARNLGAEHASGDCLLFTVQDALPPSDLWLHELFRAMKDNEVAAISCAEFPRENADLFYRVISWNHHKFLEIDGRDRIMCKPDQENHLTLRKNGQLSDVACLISREVFMKYRFRRDYAEDLDLGIRLIKDGYKLALLNSTRIIHSHNRPAYYHLKRGCVDNLYLSQIFPDRPILAIEAERLLRDIVFSYEVLNSLVYKDLLQRVTVPCAIKTLAGIVMKRFRNAVQGSDGTIIDTTNNGYIDSQFRSFLENSSNYNSANGENNFPYDGILLEAVQNFTMIIFEYMEGIYEWIDDSLLEEFKACLYKAYAFMCGTHIASCYIWGTGKTNQKIAEIHHELIKEI